MDKENWELEVKKPTVTDAEPSHVLWCKPVNLSSDIKYILMMHMQYMLCFLVSYALKQTEWRCLHIKIRCAFVLYVTGVKELTMKSIQCSTVTVVGWIHHALSI